MTIYAGQWGPEDLDYGDGTPTGGVLVTVLKQDKATPAVLWTNYQKALRRANPVAADSRGNLSFYADPGVYFLHINGAYFPVTVSAHPLEPDNDISGKLSFEQAVDELTMDVDVVHNLGYNPSLTFIDSAGEMVIGAISYPEHGAIARLSFAAPTSGTIYAS